MPEKDYDHFDDVVYGRSGAAEGGSLQGGGLAAYENVRDEGPGPEGDVTIFPCRFCGKESTVITSWEELFYLAQNRPGMPLVLPAGWHRSDRNLDCFEEIRCPVCKEPGIAIHYTPEKAKRLLEQGYQRGYFNDAQVELWKQKIRAYQR